MTITEVYERYKHLDHLLSDEKRLLDSFKGRILYDLWAAIRAAQLNALDGAPPQCEHGVPKYSCPHCSSLEAMRAWATSQY